MKQLILLRICAAVAIAGGLMLQACGGGASAVDPHFQGPDTEPGTIWNGGNNTGGGSGGGTTPPLADLVDAQPIVGSSSGAPLGTNPKYHVQEVAPELKLSLSASRAGSALVIGEGYDLVGTTITEAGGTPDFDNPPTDFTVDEGDKVELWAKIELGEDIPVPVTFEVPETSFSSTSTIEVDTDGTYTISYPHTVPYLPDHEDTPSTYVFTIGNDPPVTETLTFVVIDTPTITRPKHGWQMAWETQLVQTDYDYNDLIVYMEAQETLDSSSLKVVQIDVLVKAIARGEGYSADWQFNLDADLEKSFPGAESVTSTTQLYKAGGLIKDGPMRSWDSTMGVSIPVFTPVRNVLPSPPGQTSVVNTQDTEPWYAGGLAKIRIIPSPGIEEGTYQPLPWTNQMLIRAEDKSDVYVISLRTNRGGNKSGDDPNPLGFILPADSPAYNWPLENVAIQGIYDAVYEQAAGLGSFADWVLWWNLTDPAVDVEHSTYERPDGTIMHYGDPEPRWWMHDPANHADDAGLCYQTGSSSNLSGGPPLPIPN